MGRVTRTDGTPWRNAKVSFRRCRGTHTPTSQFPPDTIIAHTNQDGDLYSVSGDILISGVYLWCNAEGFSFTPYVCNLPNDAFEFKLPIGTTPITLSELREGSGEATEPQYESILEYVDDSIENALSNLQLGSTQIYSNEFTASTNLSALRVVNLATKTYASNQNILDATGTFGLTTTSVNQGESVKLLTYGEISDSSFDFQPGNLFLGTNGNIIQNLLGNEIFIVNMGSAISNNKIHLDFQEVTLCI